MSVNYGSKPRRDFIKAIQKAGNAIDAAYVLFTVTDELLIESGDTPILDQNKQRIASEIVAINKHLHEIKITMAEDKHGRIRNGR